MTESDSAGRRRQLVALVVRLTLRELERYGRRIRWTPWRPVRAVVIVEVQTVEALTSREEARVTEQVLTYGETAAWLRAVSVRFLVADQRVAKQPVTARVVADDTRPDVGPDAGPAAAAYGPDGAPGPAEARQMVLIQNGLRAQVLVLVDDRPKPFLRGWEPDRGQVDTMSEVRIPDAFADVPRGHLLSLVRDGDHDDAPRIAVLRSTERSDIEVAVDDQVLSSDDPPYPLPQSGTITFDQPDAPELAALRYAFAHAGHPRLFSGMTSGDPSPMYLDMVARRREVRLCIEPPPLDQAIRFKDFPVAVAGQAGPMTVEILYTEAVTDGRAEERWHVKLYACPTPQHAAALRRYLRDQSRIIPKVNTAAAAAGSAKPVIAPIYLAPPLSETKQARETGMRRTELDPEVAAEAARLSIWFGSPDVPQPDKFVIVVSLLLQPVRWPATREAPDLDALADLRPVARAVQQCHAQKTLHGDVTPLNVCSDDGGYLLVDGDAITPLANGHLLRRNVYYTSRAVMDLVEGRVVLTADGPGFDYREHDRFGFALLALTALAGSGTTSALLTPDGGEREIDDPELVASELTDQWQGQRWPQLIGTLTAPFRPGSLQQTWDPVQWLDKLTAAAAADQADPGGAPRKKTLPPPPPDPFAQRVRGEVQDALRDGMPARNVGPAIIEVLDRHLLAEARDAERRARLWALLPIAIAAVLLAGVLWGW